MANTIVRIAVPLSMMIAPYVVLSKQHMNEGGNLEQPRDGFSRSDSPPVRRVIHPTFLSLFHPVY